MTLSGTRGRSQWRKQPSTSGCQWWFKVGHNGHAIEIARGQRFTMACEGLGCCTGGVVVGGVELARCCRDSDQAGRSVLSPNIVTQT